MSTESTQKSKAYLEAKAARAALGNQLFELLVKDNWYGTLGVALSSYGSRPDFTRTYREEPIFDDGDTGYPDYVGGGLIQQARKFKAEALGEKIDDDRLKELIEEVLKDELDKYNIELRWFDRHSWDGSDRILCIFSRS